MTENEITYESVIERFGVLHKTLRPLVDLVDAIGDARVRLRHGTDETRASDLEHAADVLRRAERILYAASRPRAFFLIRVRPTGIKAPGARGPRFEALVGRTAGTVDFGGFEIPVTRLTLGFGDTPNEAASKAAVRVLHSCATAIEAGAVPLDEDLFEVHVEEGGT